MTLITIHPLRCRTESVLCATCLTNQYPYARAQGDFDEVEEERRVLYVALTRAEMN